MKITGEGENQQTIFEVGDEVRIKDQYHPMCGFYGFVRRVDGDEGLRVLSIARSQEAEEGEATYAAENHQVEAN